MKTKYVVVITHRGQPERLVHPNFYTSLKSARMRCTKMRNRFPNVIYGVARLEMMKDAT